MVKTCPFCNSAKPRPERSRVSGVPRTWDLFFVLLFVCLFFVCCFCCVFVLIIITIMLVFEIKFMVRTVFQKNTIKILFQILILGKLIFVCLFFFEAFFLKFSSAFLDVVILYSKMRNEMNCAVMTRAIFLSHCGVRVMCVAQQVHCTVTEIPLTTKN